MVLFDNQEILTEEEKRLREDREHKRYWKKWGTYLSERQWATGLFPYLRQLTSDLTLSQSAKIIRKLQAIAVMFWEC